MSCKHKLLFAWHHDNDLIYNKVLIYEPLIFDMNSFQVNQDEVF